MSFKQLIEAVGPDTIDPDEQMVMRIGPGVTYDQFAWTLYALANQRYDISHILVETTANHYDVIPFIAPRLSPKAQLTPFITMHDVEGCERHTLIQLGSLHDELLSCVEQHGAGESLVVTLQSSPSSPGMTHTYRQDSESSSMLELCTSAHFDALEFAQPPSRACRPWLRLGWNQGQNSIKALTVMLREQAIDLTFDGADILRCDEEPSPHPLCPPPRDRHAPALSSKRGGRRSRRTTSQERVTRWQNSRLSKTSRAHPTGFMATTSIIDRRANTLPRSSPSSWRPLPTPWCSSFTS